MGCDNEGAFHQANHIMILNNLHNHYGDQFKQAECEGENSTAIKESNAAVCGYTEHH